VSGKLPEEQLMNTEDGRKPLLVYEHKLRSRYAETDQMGYVYHGRFLEYFEEARTEMIRKAGVSYKKLEEAGVMLPVMHVSVDYRRPVYYDELMTVRVLIYDEPSTRLRTHYEVLSESGKVKLEGKVVLCFVDTATRRPCNPPDFFVSGMKAFMEQRA
jgi:acyl-CoA thioester hydrolase